MTQYEIKITGRVQGVGFRYFAVKKANEIGISGWVKNGRDGGVTIIAQGSQAGLDTFVDYLKIGPALSRVDRVLKYEMPISGEFPDFEVRY